MNRSRRSRWPESARNGATALQPLDRDALKGKKDCVMTMKLAPSRVIGSVVPGSVALLCALAGACATSGTAASSAGAGHSTNARDAVVRCYANDYRKRTGVAPALDDKTDLAADQILTKYNGDPKRTCDAIIAAMSSCGAATALSSVSGCDDRTHARKDDLDPTTKAQLDSSVRSRESGAASPGGRGF
jgi:hypothetical protein